VLRLRCPRHLPSVLGLATTNMDEKQLKTVVAVPTQEISDMPDAARGRLLSVLQVQFLTAKKHDLGMLQHSCTKM